MLPDWSMSTKMRSRHGAPHRPESALQRIPVAQSICSQPEPSEAQRRCVSSSTHSDCAGGQTVVTHAPRRQARSGQHASSTSAMRVVGSHSMRFRPSPEQ